MRSPSVSGNELLRQYFENERTIKALQQEIDNERTIAELQAEIADLKYKLNSKYGGKKRSNRRKPAMRNKRTIKGSRMHKKMH